MGKGKRVRARRFTVKLRGKVGHAQAQRLADRYATSPEWFTQVDNVIEVIDGSSTLDNG